MKRFFLLISILMVSAFCAKAQQVRAEVGISYATIIGPQSSPSGFDPRIKVSYAVTFDSPVFLETGIAYTGKRFTEHSSGYMPTVINYMQIPLLVGYSFKLGEKGKFSLEPSAGAYCAYGFEGYKINPIGNRYQLFDDITGYKYYRFDAGLAAQVRLQYHHFIGGGFNLTLGYERGLANVSKTSDVKLNTSCMYMTVGYLLDF